MNDIIHGIVVAYLHDKSDWEYTTCTRYEFLMRWDRIYSHGTLWGPFPHYCPYCAEEPSIKPHRGIVMRSMGWFLSQAHRPSIDHHMTKSGPCRKHFGYGLSQWETSLHCNVVSHWRSPYPDLFLLVSEIKYVIAHSTPPNTCTLLTLCIVHIQWALYNAVTSHVWIESRGPYQYEYVVQV